MVSLAEIMDGGQSRRRWLEGQGDKFAKTLSYYLGPGVNVDAFAQAADMLNPVSGIERAGTAARGVVRPGATIGERVNALGNMSVEMAGVLAPMAAAGYADDAARGLTEGLANLTMPADDALGRFVLDEDGALRAWHGSPHDFDRFDMSKIGTGEGAQAYGHGLYFAENKRVAKGYRDALSGNRMMSKTMRVDGDDWFNAPVVDRNALKEIYPLIEKYDSVELALDELKERAASSPLTYIRLRSGDLADYLEKNIDRIDYHADGRLYEVEIDANPEDFLDWDAPLSAQPGGMRAIERLAASDDVMTRLTAKAWRDNPPETGQQMVRALSGITQGGGGRFDSATNAGATDVLREAGIPGIRYLDAGSRGAGDGSRNYVVFDDSIIRILNKYGLAGLMAGGAYSMAPEEQY